MNVPGPESVACRCPKGLLLDADNRTCVEPGILELKYHDSAQSISLKLSEQEYCLYQYLLNSAYFKVDSSEIKQG